MRNESRYQAICYFLSSRDLIKPIKWYFNKTNITDIGIISKYVIKNILKRTYQIFTPSKWVSNINIYIKRNFVQLVFLLNTKYLNAKPQNPINTTLTCLNEVITTQTKSHLSVLSASNLQYPASDVRSYNPLN